MIDSGMKRARLFAAGALGALLFTAGPVAAQYGAGYAPLHEYHYYSDSTFTEEVGYEKETCNDWGVGMSHFTGTATNYVQTSIWAYCKDGMLYPRE